MDHIQPQNILIHYVSGRQTKRSKIFPFQKQFSFVFAVSIKPVNKRNIYMKVFVHNLALVCDFFIPVSTLDIIFYFNFCKIDFLVVFSPGKSRGSFTGAFVSHLRPSRRWNKRSVNWGDRPFRGKGRVKSVQSGWRSRIEKGNWMAGQEIEISLQ
jgi:hypothetical protein